MKVEDIQIGDWVQNPLGAPYQVLAIHFYKINGDGDGYYGIHLKNKGSEARLEIYDLHPIPLTPEILEKNGFRETDVVVVGTRKMRWESEDTRTEITIWMDDTMPMEIRKNIYYEDEERYTLPFAWAVHELQHALRLCGIEKTIELL